MNSVENNHKYGPTDIKSSALELIGNTPMVALDRIWNPTTTATNTGRILAKCEFLNPTGSVKDRSAYSMVKYAKQDGALKDGAPIIEVTSGNQGAGIAMVGAILQHPVMLTMSTGNSPQRAEMMRGLGARCELAPQVEGTPGNVTLADVEAAGELAQKHIRTTPNIFYVDQFNNANNCRAHEENTGPEIWHQTGGRVDVFLDTMGTGGTFVGVARYLKQKNPAIKCIVVEPAGAEVVAGKVITKLLHVLQGSGYGKIPELFDHTLCDGTIAVSDDEAKHGKTLLGAKEGLYVGYTSGANVAAAIKLLSGQVCQELFGDGGKRIDDLWIVTMLNDSGLKYSEEKK